MYQRVVFGPIVHEENARLADLSGRELTVLAPVLALCLAMGLFPTPFLTRMQPALDRILARVHPAATTAVAAVPAR
jgi:NADH-quinone oxidoreductase subunit M